MGSDAKLIINFATGQPVCERVVVARHPLSRMKGLMGRRALEPDEGLLLRPAPSIHTWFMRFAIDVVFLDAELQVIGVVEVMRPWRLAAKRHARGVLELAAGEIARRSVAIGDRLVILDSDAISLNGDPNGDSDGAGADRAAHVTPDPEPELASHSPASDDLHPPYLSVMLIAHDRRFRSVASVLLERRGCAVTTGPSSDAQLIAELVARKRVDVVVVDAGAMLTAAARTVATLEALTPPVGVVVVSEEAETGLYHMPVLAKWGPFEDFFEAIERADRNRGVRSRIGG